VLVADDSATKEQIDEKVKALTEVSHKLAEAMYKKDEGAKEGGKPDNSAKDEDVIDAEVE